MALKTLKPGARLKKIGTGGARITRSVNGPAQTWGTGGARGWKWQKLRAKMLEQYKYTCANCGRVQLPSNLDLDHIVNVAAGGSMWDESNLQILCRDTCHKIKSKSEAKLAQHGYNPNPAQ